LTEHLEDLADYVRDLTAPGHHVEPYAQWEGKTRIVATHKSEHESLISQLRTCSYDRARGGAGETRPGVSVPHIDIDAIDRMEAIRRAAREWLDHFGIPSRSQEMARNLTGHAVALLAFPYGPPAEVIRAASLLTACATRTQTRVEMDIPALLEPAGRLAARIDGGALTAAEVKQARGELDALVYDVARWRVWCRVFAGWETPPWRPHVPCPATVVRQGATTTCGALPGNRAGLRVRLEHPRSAVCLSCDTTWDSAAMGILAGMLGEVRRALDARVLERSAPYSETQNRGARS
jgi:hypothetical protein